MDKTIQRLVRPNILNLAPYTCARNEYTGEARAWLDANENSLIDGLNRYPDPLQLEVKKRLSELRGVPADNIFLGVGSDECIDLCYRVFCRPGKDNVVAIDPTYGMYKVCADINDVEYRAVDLNPDYSINVDRLLADRRQHQGNLDMFPKQSHGQRFPSRHHRGDRATLRRNYRGRRGIRGFFAPRVDGESSRCLSAHDCDADIL